MTFGERRFVDVRDFDSEMLRQQQRLIAKLSRGAIWIHNRDLRRTSPVTPRKNIEGDAALEKQISQQLREGRFSRPADTQVSNAHHGTPQIVRRGRHRDRIADSELRLLAQKAPKADSWLPCHQGIDGLQCAFRRPTLRSHHCGGTLSQRRRPGTIRVIIQQIEYTPRPVSCRPRSSPHPPVEDRYDVAKVLVVRTNHDRHSMLRRLQDIVPPAWHQAPPTKATSPAHTTMPVPRCCRAEIRYPAQALASTRNAAPGRKATPSQASPPQQNAHDAAVRAPPPSAEIA